MKLFGQHVHAPIVLVAVAEFCLAGVAFLAAAWLLSLSEVEELWPREAQVWRPTLAFGIAVALAITAMGLYHPKQRLRLEGVLIRLGVAVALASVCAGLVALLWPPRIAVSVWISSAVLTLLLLGAVRSGFSKFLDRGAFRRRVLVYGAGHRAGSILNLRRRSDQRGFKVVAFLTTGGDRSTIEDERVVSLDATLLGYARQHDIDEIVVAMDERRREFPVKDLLECKFAGIEVIDLLNFMERETGKVKVDLLNPAWLIFSEGFAERRFQSLSRGFDLLAALLLTLVFLPVMAVVAVAILLEDGRPVLYRQRRVGFRGRPFVLYKIRSMVKNAEADGRAQWAGDSDSRVTRVGRVIRKLRFDELPQLFNVILGDMSLVGPRPERPEFVEGLVDRIPYYHERHSVTPGITGWAQLNYPYGSSEQDALEKLQFDLYYVKHRSLMFDLMVLLQTVEVVLWGKGAR